MTARKGLLLAVALLGSSCVSYTSGYGYRAQEAAKAQDLDSFKKLMHEAATEGPRFMGDRPISTVMTHYMSMGAHPEFLTTIAEWRKQNWIDQTWTCPAHRARYRGLADSDPETAQKSAAVCLERARAHAQPDGNKTRMRACIEDAPFLAGTSTIARKQYIEIAANADEPDPMRKVLLKSLTQRYLQSPATRIGNGDTDDPKEAKAAAMAQITEHRAALEAIVDAVAPTTEIELLADGTAFGALELERVSLLTGQSILADFANSDAPTRRELAWAWISAMKAKSANKRLHMLGVFSKKREPRTDAYWHVCSNKDGEKVSSLLVRTATRAESMEFVRKSNCDGYEFIDGPYPLRVTARHVAAARHMTDPNYRAIKPKKVIEPK